MPRATKKVSKAHGGARVGAGAKSKYSFEEKVTLGIAQKRDAVKAGFENVAAYRASLNGNSRRSLRPQPATLHPEASDEFLFGVGIPESEWTLR